MKNNVLIILFATSLLFVSCGEDDVKGLACDAVDSELRSPVELALKAYNEKPESKELCSALKKAIDVYRGTECGADDAYAREYDNLSCE